jgi:hypothetical protein
METTVPASSEPSHEKIVADQQFATEAGRLVFALS